MKSEYLKRVMCVSSVLLLAVAGLQGCSDEDGEVSPSAGSAGTDAGAAGETASEGGAGGSVVGDAGSGGTTVGAAGAVEAGAGGETAGAGGEGGAVEPTQAELCVKFCADEATICTAANEQYATGVQCLAVCNTFARGEEGDTEGNTLDCRIYHLRAAGMSTMNATTHCPHTAVVASGFCVN